MKPEYLFRNDDVSWDTNLNHFKSFCARFHAHRFVQCHGITLYGNTNVCNQFANDAIEYAGYPSLSKLPNSQIRQLSQSRFIGDQTDLITYLNSIPDDIALHGLYHTDYSTMSYKEQYTDIAQGLKLLKTLFPDKKVTYFIAPFNRTNAWTYVVGREFGLEVLSENGIHFESVLQTVKIRLGIWHRYHHHRFYPESCFNYYKLNLTALNTCLKRVYV